MRKFTDKQAKFIAGKARGLTNKEAGIKAGFAPNSIDVSTSKLLARPEIKAAINKAKAKLGVAPTADAPARSRDVEMQRDHYADPMDFLEDIINNKELSITARARAAEQLMPYRHARIGEKGKKDHKNDAAAKVASGSKLSPGVAPGGKVVNIRG